MVATQAQINMLATQIEPLIERLKRIILAIETGQVTNEIGQTVQLSDAQVANALTVLKTVSGNINTQVQAL